jgi:hypothetical protein
VCYGTNPLGALPLYADGINACSVLFYLGKPAKVRQVEIDAIRQFLKLAENHDILTSGDKVEIIAGAIAHYLAAP